MIPDSMAWTTMSVGNGDVDTARADGDTIITHSDARWSNVDVRGVAYMNTISIWTIPGSCNIDIVDIDVVAAMETNVETLTIWQTNVADSPLWNIAEF